MTNHRPLGFGLVVRVWRVLCGLGAVTGSNPVTKAWYLCGEGPSSWKFSKSMKSWRICTIIPVWLHSVQQPNDLFLVKVFFLEFTPTKMFEFPSSFLHIFFRIFSLKFISIIATSLYWLDLKFSFHKFLQTNNWDFELLNLSQWLKGELCPFS